MTDAELLDQYRRGSHDAFSQLVCRHINWVYGLARRRVGDAHRAEDAVQATFTLLARKVPRVSSSGSVSSWLFQVANLSCQQVLRIEHRNRVRETEAAKMREQWIGTEAQEWTEMAPMLDELVGRLRQGDRQAILLRFYEEKSYPQIGEALRISEEAARKRVSRAVEQLRGLFARRGVTVGAASLATMMGANLSQPASAALIAAVQGGGAAATAAPIVKGTGVMLAWMSFKPIVAAIMIGLITTAITAVALQSPAPQQNAAAAPTSSPATAPAAEAQAMRYGRAVSPDGKPVAGAQVWLFDSSQPMAAPTVIATATTDADGRFAVRGGADWEMTIVKADGFAWSGAGLGDKTSAADPGEVRLLPRASLRVKFLDPLGNPAAGARVRLAGVRINSRATFWVAQFSEDFNDALIQTADAQGVCVFPDLPQGGTAWLQPMDQTLAAMGYSNRFDLLDSQTTDGGVYRMKLGGSVSGRVFFQDTQAPAAGIKVFTRYTNWGSDTPHARTDAQGRYALKQLPPGEYAIALWLSNEMSEKVNAVGLPRVSVAAGAAVEGQDFPLISGGIIRGKVTEKDSGKPIAKAEIFIDGPARPVSGYTGTAITREDGTYVMHVPPGKHRVQYSLPLAPGMLEPKPISRQFEVADGETVEMNFALPKYPGPSVHGRTVDSQGNPIGGVEINAQPDDEFPPGLVVTTSDVAGNFTLPALDPVTQLRARKGRWTTLQPLRVGSIKEPLVITLRNDAQLSIRAHITQTNGAPIAGANVILISMRSGRVGYAHLDAKTTSADGTCIFKQVSPDIEYMLRVEMKGFSIGETAIQIEPGKQIEVPPIKLIKADSFVAGMVMDENGSPVADANVSMDASQSLSQSVRTDAAGRFRIEGIVPSDQVRLSARIDTRDGGVQGVTPGADNVIIDLGPRATR